VGGLITLQNKTVDGISTAKVGKEGQSSLNRFLTEAPWDESALERKYHAQLRLVQGRQSAMLVIDDSLAKKTGKHIDDTQYHKNHVGGQKYIFGHQFVTAGLKFSGQFMPLFPRLYSKRTCSKIEFAKKIIEQSSEIFHVDKLLLDSWYMSKDIIKLALRRGSHVIGCLKSNRTAAFERGEWQKLSAYQKQLKTKNFTLYMIDDQSYRIHERIVRLQSIGFVKLLISRQWMAEDKKWSRPFYLISTDVSLSSVKIIRTYANRWSIETFHRDVKQHLGIEDCQLRGRRGIIRHLILATLAYAILKLWQFRKGIQWTIGETVRYIQGRVFDDLLITIVEENDLQKRWELIEPFISKTAKV
jgi:hypothetical protein